MKTNSPLRGVATISFYAADHEAAKQWYTEFLGFEPYFNRPGYVEFRLGDYQHELGIIDSQYAPDAATNGPAGVIAYWHVDNLEATLDKLISRGHGFVTASVVDPFGNILGIMSNPHYLEVLKATV
jgi:predicted enzyme related to lactoylglutathione lyase